MQKLTKKLSLAMVALFTVFTFMSYMPAKAATVVPKVQFVGEQKLEYTAGERITFNLNAANYGGRVQYRVVLWNDATKSYSDLWNTADKYYTNWMPYGNETLPLGWIINEPGSYRITVYVKRAGLVNDKTALVGQNCDSFLNGPAFVINPAAATPVDAESVAPVADVTVVQDATPVLPTEVTLNLKDSKTATAKVTWAAVDTTKVGTYAVEGTVEGTELKATVNVIVTAAELEVESVEALNNKQLEVVFSSPVDDETAVDEDNYSLESSNKDLTVVGADFALSADAMTLVITLPVAADQQDSVDLTIDGVEGLEETTVEDIEFLDTTLPKALSAEIVGNDTVKITFSEPIETVDEADFEINDGDYYIDSVLKMNNDTEVNITLYSDLEEGKIDVAIGSGIEDYAGFNVLKTTLSATVVVDEDAPVVVEYKNATPTGVTLVFNEDIEIKDGDQENFYHTNTKNYVDADVTALANVDGKELTLNFTDNELPEGTAYVYVVAKSVNDLWDNANGKIVVKVEVKVDLTKPELKTLKVNSEEKITLTFTEEIDSVDEDNFIILDKDGKEVEDIIDNVKLDEDKVEIEFNDTLSGDYKLVIEDLEDLAGNVIADTTKAFTVDDMTDPEYEDFTATIYNAGAKGQMIKVNFDQEMAKEGKYSVLDAERYIIGGENLEELVYEIKLVDDGEAVEIEIASLKDDKDDGVDFDADDSIVLARVADAAGNYTAALSGTIEIDPSGSVAIDSVEATDINTVVVTFDDYFTDFDANDVKLFYNDGIEKELTITRTKTSVNDGNETVVTFTIKEDLDFNGLYEAETVYAKVVEVKSVNKYDETLTLYDTEDLEDGISPEVATVKVDDDDVDDVIAEAGKILITMTEAINLKSLSTKTFVVENYNVVSVELGASNVVVLNVTPKGTKPASPVVETAVTQKVAFEDVAGNEVSGLSLEVYKVDQVLATVFNAIADLPAVITLADKDDVEAARTDYDALTEDQKDLVTNLEVLEDAEATIADLEAVAADIAAAETVADAITALSAEITLANKADVEAARADYDGLTEAQQALVTNLEVLEDAEATIVDLEAAAETVYDAIAALPNPVTITDKADVEAARAGYDGLTEAQQALVTNLDVLVAAEAKIVELDV